MKQIQFKVFYAYLAPVLLLAAQLLLISPLEIYLKNSVEVTVGLGDIVFSLLPAFLVVLICLTLPYALLGAKYRVYYRNVISVLAILVWIIATFLFGEYGQLDGRGLNIDPYSLLSFVQLVVIFLFVVIVLVSKKARDMLGRIVTAILFVLVLTLTIDLLRFVDAGGLDKEFSPQASFHTSLLEFSQEKNIIHIVLDEFQTDVMAEILDQNPALEKAFSGFYFFENTASVYPTTVMSIPSMLSGKVYRNEIDKYVYLDKAFHHNEFFQSLESNNYQLDFHTLGRYCGNTSLKNCTPIFTGAAHSLKYDLIDLSLFKSLPDIFKVHVYNNERWLIRSTFGTPRQYAETKNGNAYLLWREYIAEIGNSASKPSYKFFHSLITHSPQIFGADCSLRQVSADYNLDNYRQQGICALRQVGDFLERLKELGVYDNSFIVVSSDHGSTYVEEDTAAQFIAGEISPKLYSFSRALLMIKPVASKNGFTRTRIPASLLDIPNTMLGSIALESVGEGVNVFDLDEDEQRTRQYIYYEWKTEYWDKSSLPPLRIFSIDGPIDNPASWEALRGEVDRGASIERELQCGESVEFGQELGEDFVTTDGLSGVESWGRWSDRKRVFIRFRLGDEVCKNQRLNIRARAYVVKGNPHVTAGVLVNGQYVGDMSFHESERGFELDQIFAFRLNGVLKKNAVNELQLDIEGANSPLALGENSDGRLIGIALEAFSVE